jgi:probable rRNA maturation factor
LIDIEVEDAAWTDAVPDAEALVRVAAEEALRTLSSSPASAGGGMGSITFLLTDDAAVRELNTSFRGKDAATNVLSFPAPPNPENHLGDVALAFGVCAREAAEQGKPLGHHLQHLTVHGVLHLLGYDHIGDDEAEAMEGLERTVLAGLGVPDPYAAG